MPGARREVGPYGLSFDPQVLSALSGAFSLLSWSDSVPSWHFGLWGVSYVPVGSVWPPLGGQSLQRGVVGALCSGVRRFLGVLA